MIIFALGLRVEQKWYAPNMGLLTTPAAGATQGLQQAPSVGSNGTIQKFTKRLLNASNIKINDI